MKSPIRDKANVCTEAKILEKLMTNVDLIYMYYLNLVFYSAYFSPQPFFYDFCNNKVNEIIKSVYFMAWN